MKKSESTEDFSDIQKMLRLKRYEQPPPGYFDDFLHSFQQRQREEMLRSSSIRLFFERLGMAWRAFLYPRPWPKLAYAAGGVYLALMTLFIVNRYPVQSSSGTFAEVSSQTQPVEEAVVGSVLGDGIAAPAFPERLVRPVGSDQPHYVLDIEPSPEAVQNHTF